MLCRATLALVFLGGVCALAPDAGAQDRIALVIGNDRYPNLPSDKQLTKAVNDSRAIGEALGKLGYKVIAGENLTRQEMVDKLFAFTREIKPGDTAALFFAGHGVAIGGGNYLLPSDVRPAATGEEARVRNMALGEAEIIADIQERKARVAVLVLDACRDNPFRQPGVLRTAGAQRGLVRSGEAEGVFAIYSAGFGQSALDALGPDDQSPNSVFTRVLAPALARTDAHLGEIIIDVREQVSKLARGIGHQQSPAYYDQTLGGRVYLAGIPKPDSTARSTPDRSAADGFANVVNKVIDSVVTVSSSQSAQDAAKNPDGKPKRSRGSGFVVDPSGLILTANSIIEDPDILEVGFTDGSRLKATLVAVDEPSELAVIRVSPAKSLTALTFGDSESLQIGARVIAIGNRLDLGNTVSAGIISGLNREIQKGSVLKYIETDVAYKGMAGGPLLNLEGEVVGVNVSMIQSGPSAFGYSLPSKVAAAVFDQLRQFGEVRRPWLGVRIQQVTEDIAETLALKPARGALVAAIDDRSPAKPAGIAPGDIVVKFDGKEIKEMRDLPRALAEVPVGKTVQIVIWRKGKEETRAVRIVQARANGDKKPVPERQAAQQQAARDDRSNTLEDPTFKRFVEPMPGEAQEIRNAKASLRKAFGFDIAGLGDSFRKKYNVADGVNGLAVMAVENGSVAANRRLTAGDVIVDVMLEKTSTVVNFHKRIERLKKDGRKSVLLHIFRAERGSWYVAMPLQ